MAPVDLYRAKGGWPRKAGMGNWGGAGEGWVGGLMGRPAQGGGGNRIWY